ncbi:DUF6934 family protein [Flavobacterium sp. AG291]|uniref:DUF6934 family protein n=1 Tax=Flavobacterium sp. AG291 TaxID=2184000 RepID=UPI000E0B562F|nr:hypothetical protein [Flavobacterium sp. AG291]RDI14574.1 hypothetical protein DEU42_102271 [Flavobacterium sp. AG291]
MEGSQYELSSNGDFTVFEFTSDGKSGSIYKIVKYSKTLNENVYNLGLGDIIFNDDTTVEVDDINLSNNSDWNKVINTVVYSVYIFSSVYPKAYVLFGSNNTVKMRLYRMFLSRNLIEITKNFVVYGAVHNAEGKLVNVPFTTSQDVEGYFVKRINLNKNYNVISYK